MPHHPSPARRVSSLAMLAAPVLLLASTVLYVVDGEGMNEGELGGLVQVFAFAGLGVAAVGLVDRLRAVAPKAADALLCVALVGIAGGVGYGIDSIQAAVFATESLQETESAAAIAALQLPGILFPLGFLAIGVMLARTGAAPNRAALGLAVGAVLFPMSRIPDIEALALFADVVLVVSLGAIGADGIRYAETSDQPIMSAKLPL